MPAPWHCTFFKDFPFNSSICYFYQHWAGHKVYGIPANNELAIVYFVFLQGTWYLVFLQIMSWPNIVCDIFTWGRPYGIKYFYRLRVGHRVFGIFTKGVITGQWQASSSNFPVVWCGIELVLELSIRIGCEVGSLDKCGWFYIMKIFEIRLD